MFKPMTVTLTLALTTLLAGLPAEAEPDNGIVMMVHLHFEPWVNDVSPFFVPPAGEAIGGSLQDGQILVHAIPYGTSDAVPVVVDDAVLRVFDATGAEVLALTDQLDPSDQHICVEETGLPGHEGPISACKAFGIDAADLGGIDVFTLRLDFTRGGSAGSETYNLVAHYMIHSYIESGGQSTSLEEADATYHQATPVVMESLVDPVA